MSDISTPMIKELRDRTGAGPMDCKKALVECGADMDKAADYLRKKGLAAAAKKVGRIATEGTVISYIHGGGRIGVLAEINCETDFVARGETFLTFAKEITLQAAAMNPTYVSVDEIPAEVVAKERQFRLDQAKQSGKPEAVIGKIVEGQLAKWQKEICLLEQTWFKDDSKAMKDLLQELIAKTGENCKVRRVVRFELGEGLEKKKDDFAAEVAKQAGLA
ncbi:MAG: translation elongation factor Ts [Myxococcales bacterium]|nr:translation elongation factor Ts [Myxococcales bacterium]